MLEKKIPKTLEDCYKMNKLITNLYGITETVKAIGLVINIIIGAITAILFFVFVIQNNFLTAFSFVFLIVGVLSIIVISVLTHLISIGFESLASITLHTRISANVALYTAKRAEDNANNQNTTTPQP